MILQTALGASVWRFLLHDSLGRLLLANALLAALFLAGSALLSMLPGGVAGAIWRTMAVGMLGASGYLYFSLLSFGKVQAFVGAGEDLRRVYGRMVTAHRSPRPPFWAFGGNVQFLPWVVYNLFSAGVQPLAFEKQLLTVRGLKDKTKLESETNPRCMEDEVVLNTFPFANSQLPTDAPAIIVEPGLTCTAQDVPGSSFLRRAVHHKFRVVVVERRGHCKKLKSPRWNLFGDADDSEQIIRAVQEKLRGAPLFWIGFSSGSKLPIEAMGKFDERRENGDATAPKFVATACVCPGYDLQTCFLGFKFPYTRLCLSSTKSKFLRENENILRKYNADAYDKAANAKDLQQLLAEAAPFAGYAGHEEYFANENPVLFASKVRTPCLIINAMDDPLTVPTNAFGKLPGQEDGPSFAEMVQQSSCGLLLMAPSGSHCPFLDGNLPLTRVSPDLGSFTLSSWSDSCVLEFFQGFLAEQ
ncbi:unnamed protein product [Effrenium voratum]|nr:unnamed protein product [Effrenium voratum]